MGKTFEEVAWISSAGGSRVWRRACLAFAWVIFFLCGFGSIAEKEKSAFRFWEMEPVSESGQQQKRKLVTHGLEDQKRVSGRTFICRLACGAGIAKHESESPGGCHNAVVVDCACVSFSGEAGRVVAHDLPGPSAGLEALTCWWAREKRNIWSWEPERP